jgi:isoleucyl-tRNA synthetase
MARTREIIEQGLALRMFKDDDQQQIKVRQPLSTLTYAGEKLENFYANIIAEEVNVKAIENVASSDVEVSLDKFITPELRREGLAREVIRYVQSARKKAGLNVDDRIMLSLTAGDELAAAIEEHAEGIANETLANEVNDETYDYAETCEIEKMPLGISLKKA